MSNPPQFRRGETLTAAKLNELAGQAGRGQPGSGMHGQFGGAAGLQIAAASPEAIILVESGAWSVGTTGGIADGVNSSDCAVIAYRGPGASTDPNTYAASAGETVRVWHTGSGAEPATGDWFWAAWNRRSGRFEALAAGGGEADPDADCPCNEGYDGDTVTTPWGDFARIFQFEGVDLVWDSGSSVWVDSLGTWTLDVSGGLGPGEVTVVNAAGTVQYRNRYYFRKVMNNRFILEFAPLT